MSFTDDIKKKVWEKARVEPDYDENIVRKDACGAWIMWDKYGLRDNIFGWEIDHIFPEALGGDDSLLNLRALHCLNNISKGDDYPSYVSDVTADGDSNVLKKRNVTVNSVLIGKLNDLYGSK